jgi:acyl-coenzyme A synthetase/AMP-(fatty) acid ligase
LAATIQQGRVNAAWLTSSLFNAIVDEDPSSLTGIGQLLIGGEALSVPHVVRAQRALSETRIINGYGPTENTTFTTCYPIPAGFPAHASSVPIGLPITGTEVVVADESMRPVAAGQEGELIALGDGLALEYLGNPEVTAQRFVMVSLDGGARRGYRTGDRVVRRADGVIEYLGRFDDQVKIDGHRIEPGEIETVASRVSGVRECRVIVRLSPNGQRRLVAYVISSSPDAAALRARLAELLPAYMVPHFVCFVDALPLTANGKLDKARLPDPFVSSAAPSVSENGEVAQVFDAWKSILGHAAFTEDVNFFDAGGTSIEAVKLQAMLGDRFGRPLAATFVFEHPTMRRQAAALRGTTGSNEGPSRGAQRRQALARAGRGAG